MRLPRPLLTALALAVLGAGWLPAARGEGHRVTGEVDGARVEMLIPADLQVGSSAPLEIKVIPASAAGAPVRLRARLGMPEHGHWVTAESAAPAGATAMSHPGEFPMGGLYRLRVWLDFPDGRSQRTGADFRLDGDGLHAPRPAP